MITIRKKLNKSMKTIPQYLIFLILLSCDYETHVVNIVHEDGSVKRVVTVKNSKEEFDFERFRVPVDSTWTIEIKPEINEENDTSGWIMHAEKEFAKVDEINLDYGKNVGQNDKPQRSASFNKKFRWFNTLYQFSERVERVLDVDCSLDDFLTEEEMKFVYVPQSIKDELTKSEDSIQFKQLFDSIEHKSEEWMWTSLFRKWMDIFYNHFGHKDEMLISREEMMDMEHEVVRLLMDDTENESDTLTKKEDISDEERLYVYLFGQEFYDKHKAELDSTITIIEELSGPSFVWNAYDLEMRMPGQITSTNGFVHTTNDPVTVDQILWHVSGDFFLTEPYVMWAESKVSNYWAWVISGLFVVFVVTGLVLRKKK